MKIRSIVISVLLSLGLSACADTEKAPLYEPASRAAMAVQDVYGADEIAPLSLRVRKVHVEVPDRLRVSEADRYLPKGDIVWREDPVGDRHEQVRVIVQSALEQGVSTLTGQREVDVQVEITRFHALGEKARYSIGGVHAIQFYLTLLDPQTGAPLGEPRFVKADFEGLGGTAALMAESQGITQKVRIINHLAQVIQTELTDPAGHRSDATGLIAAMNQY